jgi:hypothetical protein
MKSTPILGTTARLVHSRQALHRLSDEIVMAGLVFPRNPLSFAFEADIPGGYGHGWYACVMFSDGRGTLRGESQITALPPEDIADRLYYLAVRLNRDEHRGGHWVTLWAKGCINAFWRDRDGDLQFSIGFDDAWPRMRHLTVDEFASRCIAAHDEWREQMKQIDASNMPTFKRALF